MIEMLWHNEPRFQTPGVRPGFADFTVVNEASKSIQINIVNARYENRIGRYKSRNF